MPHESFHDHDDHPVRRTVLYRTVDTYDLTHQAEPPEPKRGVLREHLALRSRRVDLLAALKVVVKSEELDRERRGLIEDMVESEARTASGAFGQARLTQAESPLQPDPVKLRRALERKKLSTKEVMSCFKPDLSRCRELLGEKELEQISARGRRPSPSLRVSTAPDAAAPDVETAIAYLHDYVIERREAGESQGGDRQDQRFDGAKIPGLVVTPMR